MFRLKQLIRVKKVYKFLAVVFTSKGGTMSKNKLICLGIESTAHL